MERSTYKTMKRVYIGLGVLFFFPLPILIFESLKGGSYEFVATILGGVLIIIGIFYIVSRFMEKPTNEYQGKVTSDKYKISPYQKAALFQRQQQLEEQREMNDNMDNFPE